MLGAAAIGESSLAATSAIVTGSGGSFAESLGETSVLADGAVAIAVIALAFAEVVASDVSSTASGAAADDAVSELIAISAHCFVDGDWLVEAAGAAAWLALGHEEADWMDAPAPFEAWNKQ